MKEMYTLVLQNRFERKEKEKERKRRGKVKARYTQLPP